MAAVRTEYFTKYGNNIIVNQSGNIAQGRTNEHQNNTVYGNHIINLERNDDCKYEWIFEVSQLIQINLDLRLDLIIQIKQY